MEIQFPHFDDLVYQADYRSFDRYRRLFSALASTGLRKLLAGNRNSVQVSLWMPVTAAVLLSFERICYLWIWRSPERFRYWCRKPPLIIVTDEPVEVLQSIFWAFKALQGAVFVSWCWIYNNGSLWPASTGVLTLGFGAGLVIAGQLLNLSVFYRLGRVGVFYGNKLGYRVPWSRKFPFSCLKHPQYLGALMSVWGFFLVMRFPHDDWYLIPVVETLYYGLGAYFER
jgi:methylene-fatty-acyl-phospholipid synthase